IVRMGVGRTFQTASVFEGLTVLQNLDIAAGSGRGPLTMVRRRHRVPPEVAEAMETVGLTAARDKLAGTLAHGQKQWLEIGMLLGGEDITGLAPHQRVARGMAYVPQGQQCFPHLTTAENLRLVADGRSGGRAAVADALDLFPALHDLMGRRAGLLSGGQRQQL